MVQCHTCSPRRRLDGFVRLVDFGALLGGEFEPFGVEILAFDFVGMEGRDLLHVLPSLLGLCRRFGKRIASSRASPSLDDHPFVRERGKDSRRCRG